MKVEANIVEQYADSDIDGRIEILIRYYPNFIRLVEAFEQSLSFIIKQEKEMKRRSSLGELGVRVQTSHLSDPTAREAIDNLMIEQAIREGDLSKITEELDDDVRREHEVEIRTIRNMKEDFSVFQNSFFYLAPGEADIFENYLKCGRNAEKLSYELDLKVPTLRSRVSRSKKIVVEQTGNILTRKYQFTGGNSIHVTSFRERNVCKRYLTKRGQEGQSTPFLFIWNNPLSISDPTNEP